ncbi:sugar O-acetyltransferase [Aliivibrio sp. S4TY2]|uniref:sugar O-acetyltransferase n=1 Tax=unclassified Aliivibrio TaxID=2645654 RepID=UPI002378A2B9|nr:MULTISPECIES: sugar O-acetyltransferase [unclassified Aliivibrio]MDD9157603.1 sugar O-acetyltransferase [Aliivibrio sp. S4TY2]MDD9161434.1 sugar O-acetyltransferase [Aliivibrio sp. S4TY1]MDD9165513.1 sugar O-acetyltransferase [Aliivibrio sp. S4MY2]MDD9169463.1 sugar O-acetyltransferase [Aliivibrio sp. S4MY4]MDD9186456.1 sugar O-acetyltransferase [Aliivibrio sp. S4MY3]
MSHKLSDFSVQIPINKELCAFQDEVKEQLYDFNHSRPSEHQLRADVLQSILGNYQGVIIVPPFYCDMGKNIHFECGGFLNSGVKILDLAPVFIGEYVQIGPNVVISTAGHPFDLAERVLPIASANPIKIGDNVWIGANAVILDGVTIGDRSVIGAGSVVTKDIPSDCVAVGNPCRVIKTITHSEMPTDEDLEEMWASLI